MKLRVLVSTIMIACFAGCASPTPAPPLPSPTSSATPSTPTPAASWTFPSRDPAAIATAEVTEERIETRVGQATANSTYVVHAACEGTKSMTYRIMVANVLELESTFGCGKDTITTAFSGKQGQVEVEIINDDSTSEAIHGFADIQPQP